MDTSRIEGLYLKENYLLGLNFPIGGIIPFRVQALETLIYKYQAVTETSEGSLTTTGTIAAATQEDPTRLTLSAYNLDNVLRVIDCNHIYQVFMGIKPSAIRRYLYYPLEKSRGNLDVKPIFTKSPFGFIDGFESPYNEPSEKTEMWIPKNIDVGFAWYNPLSSAEQIDIQLLIKKYQVSVIRDADTVEAMIKGKIPVRIATIGGTDQISYDTRDIFNCDLVAFNATRQEIEVAIKMQ